MSAIARYRSAGPVAAPAIAACRRVGLGLLRKFQAILRAWHGRREIITLAALSDHELRDIGLLRADVLQAAGADLGEDPTIVLARIVQERNATRRSRS
jgi:uncharacterized protein YjiS (DUF1127 family)